MVDESGVDSSAEKLLQADTLPSRNSVVQKERGDTPDALVPKPEVQANMISAMDKLGERNQELDGHMLTTFGDGPTKLQILEGPLEDQQGRKKVYLAVTENGYKKLVVNIGGYGEYQEDHNDDISAILKEQQEHPSQLANTGYVIGETRGISFGLLWPKTAGIVDPSAPTLLEGVNAKRIKSYGRTIVLKAGDKSVSIPFSSEDSQWTHFKPTNDEQFITSRIKAAQEVAKTAVEREKELRTEELGKQKAEAAAQN